MEKNRVKGLIKEFMRYVLVGGVSFVLDYTTLVVLHEAVIPNFPGSLYIANTFGFLVGVICNYILSVRYVFLSARSTKQGQSNYGKVLFVVIGLIGLLIHQLGMFLGADLLLINYRIVKVIMAGIVLVWNYLARKHLVFRSK